MYLGFLIPVIFLVLLIFHLTKLMPAPMRRGFVLIVIAIPLSLPFWLLLYPSYNSFQRLCAGPERYVVEKIVQVDFPNLESCFRAFTMTQKEAFKGFECLPLGETRPLVVAKVHSLTRFVRSNTCNTSNYQAQCAGAAYNFEWEDRCLPSCFQATKISEPSFKYTLTSSDKVLIEDRLKEHLTQYVDDSNKALVSARDYTYYPYGNGFAKILGFASGSAPTNKCEKRNSLFELDFFKPAQSP